MPDARPAERCFFRDFNGGPLLRCAVLVAPAVFDAPYIELCSLKRSVVAACEDLGPAPLALLLQLGEDGRAARAAGGAPIVHYALYVVPRECGAGQELTLRPLHKHVLGHLRSRVLALGASPAAKLVDFEGVAYPALPPRARALRREATRLPPEEEQERLLLRAGEHLSRAASLFREIKAKRADRAPVLAVSATAPWNAIERRMRQVLRADARVPERHRRGVYLPDDVPFEQVAAWYSDFLQRDERVPAEVRRLARGLAPRSRLTHARHYGRFADGALAPVQPDSPYDALDAQRRAAEAAWPTPEDRAYARAAVNYSQHTWNAFVGPGTQQEDK
jgi:hypothetical protein